MTPAQPDDWPQVRLDPQDARTAQTAGVTFARTLAGAPSAWFMLALDEQRAIVHDGIRQAGYTAQNAKVAAHAFAAGARGEWQRIEGAVQPGMCGSA